MNIRDLDPNKIKKVQPMNIKDLDPNKVKLVSSAQPAKEPEKKKSVGGFLGNVAKSGWGLVKGTVSAVADIINPDMSKNTLVNLGKTAVGAVETLIPGRQGAEQYAEALKDYAVSRYGSLEKLKETAYNDPVGVALDLSTIISGAGAAIKGAGVVSKSSTLAKLGSATSKVGRVTNPIFPLAKIGETTVRKVGGIIGKGRDVSLGVATGKGSETMSQAVNAGKVGGDVGKNFRSAMSGKIGGEEIVGEAQGAMDVIYKKRSSAYESKMKAIQEQTGTTVLSKEGIIEAGNNALDDIGVINKKTGKLDFSERPSMDAKSIKKVADTVNNWKDTSPLGLNKLAQELEGMKKGGVNLNSADNRYNYFVDNMKKNIKSYVEKEVPGIKELNIEYAKNTDFIKDIQKELLTKDPSRQVTAMKKLQGAMRTDNKFAIELLDEIKTQTGVDLSGIIAGSNLNTYIPGGLIGRSADAFALLKGFKALVDPATLIRIAATSPKLVGNFLYALGASERFANNFIIMLKKIPKGKMDAFLKTGYYEEEANKNMFEGFNSGINTVQSKVFQTTKE